MTRGPSCVSATQATWREVGPRGMLSASRSHSIVPSRRHHTSSRIEPPLPATSGSHPPNRKSWSPTMAEAEQRRGPGRERSDRSLAGCTHSHTPPRHRQRSLTTSLSPCTSAYPPNR
eukprot:scaffold239988_cov26-Tisochrysis_lutea.AAC.1